MTSRPPCPDTNSGVCDRNPQCETGCGPRLPTKYTETKTTPECTCPRTWLNDSAHGWLRVSREAVERSGWTPSGFSYMDDSHYYLEEDCDALGFLYAEEWKRSNYRPGSLAITASVLIIAKNYEEDYEDGERADVRGLPQATS